MPDKGKWQSRIRRLFGRDIAARVKRASEERDVFYKRIAAVTLRKESLASRIRQAPVHGLVAERKRRHEVEAERKAIEADLTSIKTDMARRDNELDVISVRQRQRSRRMAQVSFALQIAGLASLFAAHGNIHGGYAAAGVQLDYYSAVAGIIPVLLVAGLVEVALLRIPGMGAWVVLNFAVAALSAMGGALYVLATHRSTLTALSLTVWGLILTLLMLLVYFVFHSETGKAT